MKACFVSFVEQVTTKSKIAHILLSVQVGACVVWIEIIEILLNHICNRLRHIRNAFGCHKQQRTF